jgi:hypothetical protein
MDRGTPQNHNQRHAGPAHIAEDATNIAQAASATPNITGKNNGTQIS